MSFSCVRCAPWSPSSSCGSTGSRSDRESARRPRLRRQSRNARAGGAKQSLHGDRARAESRACAPAPARKIRSGGHPARHLSARRGALLVHRPLGPALPRNKRPRATSRHSLRTGRRAHRVESHAPLSRSQRRRSGGGFRRRNSSSGREARSRALGARLWVIARLMNEPTSGVGAHQGTARFRPYRPVSP
jgi:hypothetical protein